MFTRFIAFRVRLKTLYAIYNKLTTLFHPPYLCLGELNRISSLLIQDLLNLTLLYV
jgi:hypothetical protein